VDSPVVGPTGRIEGGTAYRMSAHGARGSLVMGGIRYHPERSHDEGGGAGPPRDHNDLETALMDIPFGGAKGGVVAGGSKANLEARAMERLTRELHAAISIVLGP